MIYINDFKKINPDICATYKHVNGVDLPLQVYLPSKVDNAKTVLLIHGGGWKDAISDNSEWNGGWLANNAKYLAMHGFIAIVISYRSLELSNEINVSNLLDDCIDAIKYIRQNFDFVSFDDIVYFGESAGGYFSTMLGLSQDDDVRPAITVSLNPVLGHFLTKWNYGFNGIDNIEDFKPINCIGGKCANFLFLHGDNDSVVEIEDTMQMHNKLKVLNKKTEFITVQDAAHAFILFDYKNTDENIIALMDVIINHIS